MSGLHCKACNKSMTIGEARWVENHPAGYEVKNFETLCGKCLRIAMMYVPEANILNDEQYSWKKTKAGNSELPRA